MNQMTFRTDRISIILLLFLICVEFNIYAQYSLPRKIEYFLSEKEDFRKNEALRSEEYKQEKQSLFNEALNNEQFFRDIAKDLKLTYKDKEYDNRNFAILIDTLFIDFNSNQNKNRDKNALDSLISIVENNKGMKEVFEKINTVQNFYGEYFFKDSTSFIRYGPYSYSFRDTTFNILAPGNYGFHTTDSTFIQPRLNKLSDINLIIAAYIITGNKFWQKTHASWFFDDYIEKILTYVDSFFQGRDISKKIDAYNLIGDLCIHFIDAFDLHEYFIGQVFDPHEYLINNPMALEAYLSALNLAKSNDLSEKTGLTEFKISNFYNPQWDNDIVDKSLYYLNEAIDYYNKDDLCKSDIYSLMLAKRVNLECMKIFRDGGFIQTEMVETIGNLFNNRILWENKSLEIKYYYYQALGYYFASTRLKSDLSVAKIYFQTALFYAFQNFDNHGEIHPKIKQAINHLLWIYGNLNLEFEARNLYDLAFFSEDINGLGYALELMYLESYVYYNLGNIDQAQKILLTCDSLTETIQIVFNSNIRDEIKSLIYGYIVPQNDIKGTFKSRAESLEFVFKFTDDINYQILSELSNLNSIEYKYQKELLADTKMKVEREKKNIRTYSIIAIIIVGMVSAIIIGFAIWKIRRLKNLKFTSDKKAALSQVLARCMSHNIGSHALSKFMDKDVILEKETNEQYPSKFESLSHFANENGNERKELIANFNEYLKYRMDFMADIATTVQPFMETPMYFASNLFKGFDKNRILLNRISGVSSDITYQFKLFFKGGEIKSLESDSNDRKISIPNDVLGAQAFYIIIENVIRNIYKHGNPTKNVEIQIHLDEVENDKSVYQVSIFDNILKRKDDINSLVINRNMAFDEPVLESEENDRLKNKLRTTNLGTIEIAVCAAYLKGLPVTSIENVEKKLNFGSLIIPDDNYHPKNPQHKIIYAYSHCHDEDKYALGYRFYLNKPKQALIVTEGTFSLENKEDLDSIGIKVINPKELATLNHFQQQFVCFYNPADVNLITDSNRALFPKRVVFLNESVSTNSANEFFASIWKQQVTGIGEGYSGAYFVYSREKREISWSNHHHTIKAYIDNHQFNWELYYGSRSQKLADEEPQFIDKADNNLREFEYYEMGCSHSTIQKYINKDLFDTEEAILPFEYLESVFLRVMILDERMQKAIMFEPKKMYANTVPFDEYFKLQHIFIPRKDETDLNAKDLGDYQDEDSEYAKLIKYLCQRIDVVHFCVIHLGLIERMCRPGTDKTNKEIENVIGKLFPEQETRRKIVITSGRGGALNISDDLSFIPLPMLENVLLTQHDKVALTKLLYNSRKFK